MASKPTYHDNVGLPEIHYNPLQNYRNVTYTTRLTAMPVFEATQSRYERSYDYKKGTILWETGGSGTVYLEEMTMECTGSGNKTGNYITQMPISFKGKVVEPLGGRFMEALSLAALDLGYKSNDCVYLFEIAFTGYNTDSDTPEICKGWDNEDLIFRWYIRINELQMNLDYKGSTYDFEFVTSEGQAMNSDYTQLEEGFRMVGTPATVGSFCKELADALNKREEEHVKSDIRCIPHKYVITAHKDIANLKIQNGFWSRASAQFNIGRGEVQSQPGQTIQSFILGQLANSQDMMKHLHRIPEKKDYNSNDVKPGKIDIIPRNVVIIPGAKDIVENKSYAFDPKLGGPAKEIHFFITTKEDPRNIIAPQEYKDAQDPVERDKRVNHWIKQGLLRKVYKWIYTGENSEVINTTLKINYMWRNVRPLWVNSETGKPIAPSGTSATAKKKSDASNNAKTIKCDDAKTVGTEQQRVAATYAEDAQFNATTGKIEPKPGWYPHMPQFYHMNFGVQQQSQQSALSPENANEYSVYRQIGANLSGSGDMTELNLEVVGDPYWLLQIPGAPGKPPMEEDVWEYEKEHLTEDQMAEKRKKAATHTWLPFIYFEAQVPAATTTGSDTMALRESDAISGVYFTVSLTNKFTKGKFTTNLVCAREPLSNPWKGRKAQATKPGGSTPGNANSVGPSNAGVDTMGNVTGY
jgi:hypothetical protein